MLIFDTLKRQDKRQEATFGQIGDVSCFFASLVVGFFLMQEVFDRDSGSLV